MLVGADVSTAGGLPSGIVRGEAMRAEVIQIRCLSSRAWHGPRPSPEVMEAYRAAQEASKVVSATFCHAPYLINLATGDEELAGKSYENLVDNLVVASSIGSSGVVLHVGSHLGRGTDAVLEQLGRTVVAALDDAAKALGAPSCDLLLENTAGGGGTIGRSFEELGAVLDSAAGDERLGVCLDTQHLFASGVAYNNPGEAEAVIAEIAATIGLARLRCIHLNDSKVEFASNRDRHENLGAGLIGKAALGLLCSHPAIAEVPVILEVPGDGSGPRKEDVAAAKKMIAAGRRRRATAA
ncbi:MAG TPA: deoxyribonuclease IV [Acidimicrobiales bacterium]|nr:deoxyribonuclease IV [Acidimicrobiales bacterium]